jgi:hypothetical protein
MTVFSPRGLRRAGELDASFKKGSLLLFVKRENDDEMEKMHHLKTILVWGKAVAIRRLHSLTWGSVQK